MPTRVRTQSPSQSARRSSTSCLAVALAGDFAQLRAVVRGETRRTVPERERMISDSVVAFLRG